MPLRITKEIKKRLY